MTTLSVVLVAFDMAREVPRTVRSLLPPYQRGIDPASYEVLVVENGSGDPIAAATRAEWPENVRYLSMASPSPSPAAALNAGVRASRGALVCLMIDGARMVTPGVLCNALHCAGRATNPIVATLGFHLGPKPQQQSTAEGYDRAEEDRLLASVDWVAEGYRLFEISVLAGSSKFGWFGPLAESNCLFLNRHLFDRLGGFDDRFAFPGGGLVNLDFFRRALDVPATEYFLLLGEASFHQVHGGVSTNSAAGDGGAARPGWHDYVREYQQLQGYPYVVPTRSPILFGQVPPQLIPVLAHSAEMALAATAPRALG